MIKPLQIANKEFPVNLIQGPLAGITCSAFRLLTWQYSKPAFNYSEMISANALVQKSLLTQKRFITKDPDEGPVCFQLVGGTAKELGEATKILNDKGADLIDFNCGCSVPKVYGNGSGSRILQDRSKLYDLVSTMRKNSDLPLIVKIRVALDDETNKEIAKAISDAGADCLVVHGRNWKEHYNTPCRYDAIKFFVNEMKIPVIGNGDVCDLDSLKKMFATGCAGVMVARAGVGRPWLIGELMAKMQQKEFVVPSVKERGQIFISHIEHLMQLIDSERVAVLQARKFAKPYAHGLDNRKEFSTAVNQCERFAEFKKLCVDYFV